MSHQTGAASCEFHQLCTTVLWALTALEKSARDEPRDHFGNAGTLQSDLERDAVLFDLTARGEGRQKAVLHWSDTEFARFFEEQRAVQLMHPANEKSGTHQQRRATPGGAQFLLDGLRRLCHAALKNSARRGGLTSGAARTQTRQSRASMFPHGA